MAKIIKNKQQYFCSSCGCFVADDKTAIYNETIPARCKSCREKFSNVDDVRKDVYGTMYRKAI